MTGGITREVYTEVNRIEGKATTAKVIWKIFNKSNKYAWN